MYIKSVFDWAAYYNPIIASTLTSGFGILPADWVAPPNVPYVGKAPTPLEEPLTTTPRTVATKTSTRSATVTPVVTQGSTWTERPIEEFTDELTAVPIGQPTVAPLDVLVEEPVDLPVEDSTSDSNGSDEGDGQRSARVRFANLEESASTVETHMLAIVVSSWVTRHATEWRELP